MIRTIVHVDAAQREVDDCRILLLQEPIAGEPLVVYDEEGRQTGDFPAPQETRSRIFSGSFAIVLGEDGGDGNLRNDVGFDGIAVQGRWRQIEGEEEEGSLRRFDF